MKLVKTILAWIGGIATILIIAMAFLYLWKKGQSKPVTFKTEQGETADIVKKTVATGSIVPRREVEVKPKVTGVLAELKVKAGDIVKLGDPLGRISIVQDAQQLTAADAGVRTAQIAFQNAKTELARNEALLKQGVVAEAEVARFRTEFALRQQELATANSNMQLAKEGATRGNANASTLIVTATAGGMVIDVPVKEGFSVIQANNFNPGTTVAVIADMTDIIFEGRVDEAEVAKIRKDMKLAIKVGALEKETIEGRLEYIAPKGKTVDGAIQFEIRAKVVPKQGVEIRANYSANADIVLDERPGVFAIREALVQYDTSGKEPAPFVEVETAPQTFEKRTVELGLSDGIKVEIKKGVTKDDKIKIPETAGPPGMGSGGPGGKGGKPPAKK